MVKVTPSIFLPPKSVQKCSKCKEYLSIGPITIFSGGPVCGRCTPVTSFPAQFYENLAEYMFFPCINDRFGCNTMLAWGTVSAHEEICEFSPVECPALRCSKKIKKENIVDHFKIYHNDLITTPGELCVSLTDESVNKLLLWEKQTFILKISTSYYHCFLDVLSWKEIDSKKLKYDIFVDEHEKGNIRSIKSGPIVTYRGRHHDITTMSKVGWNDKKTVLNMNTAQLAINIATESTDNTLLNRKLLLELECPICFNYMKPPVFMCTIGHSICNSCKSNISSCPICQADMTSNRNFLLEKLTEHIMFPCKYVSGGCCITGTLSNMNMHEQNCQFRVAKQMKCYVNYLTPCSWRGPRSEAITHLSLVHPESYIDINNPVILNLMTLNNAINAFTEYDTHIFKVQITYDKSTGLNFSVKLVSSTQKIRYRFFLNFRDRNENHRYFSLNKFCTLTKAEDESLDQCLFIRKQMITSFARNSKLEVKLNIVEI